MSESKLAKDGHILITGGAGYIGSVLVGELLGAGYRVTVIDDLLFGGESLLAYMHHPSFHFVKSNVWEPRAVRNAQRDDWPVPNAIFHLAAIAGFPACQSVGRQVAWRYNVEATQHVFEQAEQMGVSRFIYASTYSNYGLAPDGKPVTEDTPLNPQSLYAETKIASERYLLSHAEASCRATSLSHRHDLRSFAPHPFRYDRQPVCPGSLHAARTADLPARLLTLLRPHPGHHPGPAARPAGA